MPRNKSTDVIRFGIRSVEIFGDDFEVVVFSVIVSIQRDFILMSQRLPGL